MMSVRVMNESVRSGSMSWCGMSAPVSASVNRADCRSDNFGSPPSSADAASASPSASSSNSTPEISLHVR